MVKIHEQCFNTLRKVHLIFPTTRIHDVAKFRQEILLDIESRCILSTEPVGILNDTSLSYDDCDAEDSEWVPDEEQSDSESTSTRGPTTQPLHHLFLLLFVHHSLRTQALTNQMNLQGRGAI
jgi:hypothetical protein